MAYIVVTARCCADVGVQSVSCLTCLLSFYYVCHDSLSLASRLSLTLYVFHCAIVTGADGRGRGLITPIVALRVAYMRRPGCLPLERLAHWGVVLSGARKRRWRVTTCNISKNIECKPVNVTEALSIWVKSGHASGAGKPTTDMGIESGTNPIYWGVGNVGIQDNAVRTNMQARK